MDDLTWLVNDSKKRLVKLALDLPENFYLVNPLNKFTLLCSGLGVKGGQATEPRPFLFSEWKKMQFISSGQFSRSVVSESLRPHESQHARPPCPSPTPGVYSNSCPSSRWCHPAISSSVVPFSSWPQSQNHWKNHSNILKIYKNHSNI